MQEGGGASEAQVGDIWRSVNKGLANLANNERVEKMSASGNLCINTAENNLDRCLARQNVDTTISTGYSLLKHED